MSDIATRQFDLKREYLQQKLWKNFDTWLVVRIKELEAKLDAVKGLPVQTDPYTDHCYVWYDELIEAIGEQE